MEKHSPPPPPRFISQCLVNSAWIVLKPLQEDPGIMPTLLVDNSKLHPCIGFPSSPFTPLPFTPAPWSYVLATGFAFKGMGAKTEDKIASNLMGWVRNK